MVKLKNLDVKGYLLNGYKDVWTIITPSNDNGWVDSTIITMKGIEIPFFFENSQQ